MEQKKVRHPHHPFLYVNTVRGMTIDTLQMPEM